MAAILDRESFLRPVSPQEPSGPWLRRDDLYAAVQEAMLSRLADPNYGIEEKRPDWPLVEKLCIASLSERTKDVYLAICLLESLVVNHGADGLSEGIWLVRALHERYWSDFHPRPRENGSLEGRVNQLEALRRSFPRILGRLPMAAPTHQLAYFDWKHTDKKLPNGSNGPWTAESRRRAVLGTPSEFYEQALRAVREAQGNLAWLQARVPEETCYGRSGPSLSDMLEELTNLVDELEGAVAVRPDAHAEGARQLLAEVRADFLEERWLAERLRSGTPFALALGSIRAAAQDERAGERPSEGWPAVLESRWKQGAGYEARTKAAAPVQAPGSTQTDPLPPSPTPRSGGDPLAAIFSLCRELRRRSADEPMGFVLPRTIRWRSMPDSAEEAGQLPSPNPKDRQRLLQLFTDTQWKALLEASEALAESNVGIGWLDLQRFSCVAMFELGEQYVQPRRSVVKELRAFLAGHPWLAEAKLADGSPAADEITRGWLADEVTKPANGVLVPAPRPAHFDGAVDEAALARARELFQQKGLEAATAHLREELEKARSGRERARLSQALGELCLEAKRPELAVPILEGVRRTLEHNDLGGWEGPAFVTRNLTALFRGYAAWNATPPEDVGIRRQRLAEEIARIDLGLRLQLEAQRS